MALAGDTVIQSSSLTGTRTNVRLEYKPLRFLPRLKSMGIHLGEDRESG